MKYIQNVWRQIFLHEFHKWRSISIFFVLLCPDFLEVKYKHIVFQSTNLFMKDSILTSYLFPTYWIRVTT